MAKRKAAVPARRGKSVPKAPPSPAAGKKKKPPPSGPSKTTDITCAATVLGSTSAEPVIVLCRLRCQVTGSLPDAQEDLPTVCTIGCKQPNAPDFLTLRNSRQSNDLEKGWTVHVLRRLFSQDPTAEEFAVAKGLLDGWVQLLQLNDNPGAPLLALPQLDLCRSPGSTLENAGNSACNGASASAGTQQEAPVWLGLGIVASRLPNLPNSAWALIHSIIEATPDGSLPAEAQQLQGILGVVATGGSERQVQQAPFDVARLYQAVKPAGTEPQIEVQPSGLLPTLRPFQRRSVNWMLQREHSPAAVGSLDVDPRPPARDVASCSSAPPKPPPRQRQHWEWHWRDVPAVLWPACVPQLYHMSRSNGWLTADAPEAPEPVLGGCLCEEMGLGKTIEVLACILAHPAPPAPPPLPLSRRLAALPTLHGVSCNSCSTYHDDADSEAAEAYTGSWIACDGCHAWMHGKCVGLDPNSDPPATFVCGPCLRMLAQQRAPGQARATLIVCPPAIQQQWFDELQRHAAPGALRVVVYRGQAVSLKSSCQGDAVLAADLAAADVVLTTYDVLRTDVHHEAADSGDAGASAQRCRRVYQRLPTPLTRIAWWRVILDEAQMIEGAASKAAELALHLTTRHRWCVTGTPVSKGLDDIYGLIRFLRVEPWCTRATWRNLLARPVENGAGGMATTALLALLQPALGGIMWRTAKADVAGELGIPQQLVHRVDLELSPVERHFYRRCHTECSAKARELLPVRAVAAVARSGALPADLDGPLTHKQADALLAPLLKLRQACCHPQVGAAGAKKVTNERQPQTMDEVLDGLISKDRTDAEDAQRAVLAALNGIAGLQLLAGDRAAAAEKYRAVLHAARANAGVCDVDRLQQLHAAVNLDETLTAGAAGSPALARLPGEEALPQMAQELTDTYLGQSAAAMATVEHEFMDALVKAGFPRTHTRKRTSGQALGDGAPSPARKRAASGSAGASPGARSSAAGPPSSSADAAGAVAGPAGPSSGAAVDLSLDHALAKAVEGDLSLSAAPSATPLLGAGSVMRSWRPPAASKAAAQHEAALNQQNAWWAELLTHMAHVAAAEPQPAEPVYRSDADSDDDEDDEREESYESTVMRTVRARVAEATNAVAAAMPLGQVSKFKSLPALAGALESHTRSLYLLQHEIMVELQSLAEQCHSPTRALTEQAGSCERCRAETGVPGVVCVHCIADEKLNKWEVKLFRLTGRATKGGVQVSEEEAGEQYQRGLAAKGGAGAEGAARDGASATGTGQRSRTVVGAATVTHQDNENHVVLAFLRELLKKPGQLVPGMGKEHRDALGEHAARQLDWMRECQGLFYKARQLTLRQRHHLYAHDELAMCTMRIQLHSADDTVHDIDATYRVFPHEIEVRNVELSNDKAVADSQMAKALGRLRYALNLKHARDSRRALPAAAAVAPTSAAPAAAGRVSGAAATSATAGPLPGTAATCAAQAALPGAQPGSAGQCAQAGVPADTINTTAAAAELTPAAPRAADTAAEHGTDQTAEAAAAEGTAGQAGAAPAASAVSCDAAARTGTGAGAAAFDGAAVVTAACREAQVAAGLLPVDGAAAAAATAAAAAQPLEAAGPEAECPVCSDPLGQDCMFAPCGHTLCYPCHQEMLKRTRTGVQGRTRMMCPVCRESHLVKDVAYVKMAAPSAEEKPLVTYPTVKGSYGTKLEAVVHRVQTILADNADDKVLIFSTWADVLELLQHALRVNAVPFVYGKGGKGLHNALTAFRTPAEGAPSLAAADAASALWHSSPSEDTAAAAAAPVPALAPAPAPAATPAEKDAELRRTVAAAVELASGRAGSSTGPALDTAGPQVCGDDGGQAAAAFGASAVLACAHSAADTAGGEGCAGDAACATSAAAIGTGAGKSGAGGGAGSGRGNFGRAGVKTGLKGRRATALRDSKLKGRADAGAPRVLLLLLRQAAAGLNLTEAQHAILVEPTTDPAIEAQAVGRVHRIGQTRDTQVHRFVVQHSVEASLAKLTQAKAANMDMNNSTKLAAAAKRGGVRAAAEAPLTIGDVAVMLFEESSHLDEGGAAAVAPAPVLAA